MLLFLFLFSSFSFLFFFGFLPVSWFFGFPPLPFSPLSSLSFSSPVSKRACFSRWRFFCFALPQWCPPGVLIARVLPTKNQRAGQLTRPCGTRNSRQKVELQGGRQEKLIKRDPIICAGWALPPIRRRARWSGVTAGGFGRWWHASFDVAPGAVQEYMLVPTYSSGRGPRPLN